MKYDEGAYFVPINTAPYAVYTAFWRETRPAVLNLSVAGAGLPHRCAWSRGRRLPPPGSGFSSSAQPGPQGALCPGPAPLSGSAPQLGCGFNSSTRMIAPRKGSHLIGNFIC